MCAAWSSAVSLRDCGEERLGGPLRKAVAWRFAGSRADGTLVALGWNTAAATAEPGTAEVPCGQKRLYHKVELVCTENTDRQTVSTHCPGTEVWSQGVKLRGPPGWQHPLQQIYSLCDTQLQTPRHQLKDHPLVCIDVDKSEANKRPRVQSVSGVSRAEKYKLQQCCGKHTRCLPLCPWSCQVLSLDIAVERHCCDFKPGNESENDR